MSEKVGFIGKKHPFFNQNPNRDWLPLESIDFSQESRQYHIDTRDFHVSRGNDAKFFEIDKPVIKNADKFGFTTEELKECLLNLKAKCEEIKCVHLFLIGEARYKFGHGELKYLRIYKHNDLWFIHDRDNYAVRKDWLKNPQIYDHRDPK